MSRTSLTIAALLGAACAHLPTTGVEATGEPLSVHGETKHFLVNETVKVGQVTHRDASGRVIGTSDLTQNQQRLASSYEWTTLQGATPVDEYDFFTIAGDVEAAKKVDDYRKAGLTMNRVGWGTFGVGLAAVGAGLLAGYLQSTSGEPSGAGYAVAAGGGAVAGLGYLFASLGAARLTPNRHVLDEAQARNASSRYNAALAAAAPPPPPTLLPAPMRVAPPALTTPAPVAPKRNVAASTSRR